jgi:hypothetical protein
MPTLNTHFTVAEEQTSASYSLVNRAEPDELSVGDFVEWDSSGGMARGRITRIVNDGDINVPDSDFTITGDEEDPAALIRVYRESENDDGVMEWNASDVLVGHKFSTLTKIDSLENRSDDDVEQRQVDLSPPAYMRASARRGLEWHGEGYSGDGLLPRTVREATAMSQGNITVDKWVRLRAFIARHMVDFDSPAANPNSDDFPSPGVVAIALWGGGTTKRSAQRAMDYAEGVIGRIEAENEGRAKGQAVSKMETRTNTTTFEVRELEESGGMTFEGYASVFNSRSENLGGFHEVVAPGAFKRSLQSRNDIKLLWNHDTGAVLGSTRAGSLTLTEDDFGLRIRAELPNTTLGRDTAELIRTGLVDSMSFGFSVIKDTWDDTGTNRTLNAVRIHEASIVSFPAYSGTAGTVSMRGLDRVAQRASVDVDELADALLKIESGDELSSDEAALLSRVVDELKPEDKELETVGDLGLLALKKKKLEFLERY